MKVTQHRELPEEPAVYVLTLDGEPFYCGGTVKARWRIYTHFWAMIKGIHKNDKVQALWDSTENKSRISFRILEYVPRTEILKREKYWSSKFPGILNHFFAGGGVSPEHRARKSEQAKRQMLDPTQRAQAVARCAENSKRISERLKTDSAFRAQRAAQDAKNQRNNIERFKDPEVMRKHKEGLRLRWSDPEYKAKLVPKLTAVGCDPEVRRKRSEAMKRVWSDPEYREATTANIRAGIANRGSKNAR